MAFAVLWLSPVSMTSALIPCRRSRSSVSRLASRGRSATAMTPTASPFLATRTGVRPDRADGFELGMNGRRAEMALFEQPVVAEEDPLAVHHAFGAEARQRDHVGAGRHRDRRRRRRSERSPAQSDARTAAPPRRPCATTALGADAVQRNDLDHLGRAARQRAGLVEGDALHAARPLQVRAPLDEHAFPRRAGQRRDDRHRGGDHERAGTRHDEQHERAIDPRVPRAREGERRDDGQRGGEQNARPGV